MQSQAKSVAAYLAALPAERRAALEAVRAVILANKHRDLEEGMQYGMIGYYIPHRVHPAGYHCDPTQPMPFAGLASQKNYMSLYLMCVYGDGGENQWLRQAFAKAGKKLDMGKACIRFKKLEDLPLEVVGEAFRRVSPRTFLERCESAMAEHAAQKKAAKPAKSAKSAARKAAPAKRPSTSKKK